MLGSNDIQDFALTKFPRKKHSPNGWITANCQACVHNGEPTPDTKNRMGLLMDGPGLRYHCFRCGYVASWKPGESINKKLKQLWLWMGVSNQEIMQINLQCLKLKSEFSGSDLKETKKKIVIQETSLPKNSRSFSDWASSEEVPPSFLACIEYIQTRGECLLENFQDYYWSPNMPEHFIIPIFDRGKIVGWTARLIRNPKDNTETKYYLENTNKHIFNSDLLYDENRKYIILTEGPLDAIALHGVAIMGNQITEHQRDLLNGSGKEIVVLADKDAGGQVLIEAAINNGWKVAFPDVVGFNCKDGLDMVNQLGIFASLKLIFDSATSNSLKINMLRKRWK